MEGQTKGINANSFKAWSFAEENTAARGKIYSGAHLNCADK